MSRYVDTGAQYSPEGYPPTAGAEKMTAIDEVDYGHTSYSKSRQQHSSSRPRSSIGHAANAAAAMVGSQVSVDSIFRARSMLAKAIEQGTLDGSVSKRTADPTDEHSTAIKRARIQSECVKLMPRAYVDCNPKDLGLLISNMLMNLIRLNDPISLPHSKLTRFHSRAPPNVSVADYLQRLIQHATLSPPILLSMVCYIDRLCALYSAFTINSLTVHRFLITAAIVATKMLSDSFWTNPTYARIGGVSTTELAILELEFLQRMQWNVLPKPESLDEHYNSLVWTEFRTVSSSEGSLDHHLEIDGSDPTIRSCEGHHDGDIPVAS